jgi:hypothetical protein
MPWQITGEHDRTWLTLPVALDQTAGNSAMTASLRPLDGGRWSSTT